MGETKEELDVRGVLIGILKSQDMIIDRMNTIIEQMGIFTTTFNEGLKGLLLTQKYIPEAMTLEEGEKTDATLQREETLKESHGTHESDSKPSSIPTDLKQVMPVKCTFYDDLTLKWLLVRKDGYESGIIGKGVESKFKLNEITDLKVKDWALKKMEWVKAV